MTKQLNKNYFVNYLIQISNYKILLKINRKKQKIKIKNIQNQRKK